MVRRLGAMSAARRARWRLGAVTVDRAWRRAAAAAVKVLRRVVVRWRVRRDDGVGQGRCRVIEVRAGGAGGGRRPCVASSGRGGADVSTRVRRAMAGSRCGRSFVLGHMGARHRRRRLRRAHRLWRTRRRRGVNDGSVARCEWRRKRCVGHTRASRAIGASHSPNAISASTDCPTSRNAPSPFKTIAFLPNVSAPPNCLLPR